MTSDLFPAPYSPSPRRQWLERHNLVLDEPSPNEHRCRNHAHTRSVTAPTQDEAIIAFCERYDLKHYSIEP